MNKFFLFLGLRCTLERTYFSAEFPSRYFVDYFTSRSLIILHCSVAAWDRINSLSYASSFEYLLVISSVNVNKGWFWWSVYLLIKMRIVGWISPKNVFIHWNKVRYTNCLSFELETFSFTISLRRVQHNKSSCTLKTSA